MRIVHLAGRKCILPPGLLNTARYCHRVTAKKGGAHYGIFSAYDLTHYRIGIRSVRTDTQNIEKQMDAGQVYGRLVTACDLPCDGLPSRDRSRIQVQSLVYGAYSKTSHGRSVRASIQEKRQDQKEERHNLKCFDKRRTYYFKYDAGVCVHGLSRQTFDGRI